MADVTGKKVSFVLVDGSMPTKPDDSTIYFDAKSQDLYVGDKQIANYVDDAALKDELEGKIKDLASSAAEITLSNYDSSKNQYVSNIVETIPEDGGQPGFQFYFSDFPTYTIEEASATDGIFKSYKLTNSLGTATGVTIDIPKDLVLKEGSLKTVETVNNPYNGAAVGDKYIELVLNDDSADKIIIPVKDLVDVYLADGTTMTLNDSTRTFSVNTDKIATVEYVDNKVEDSALVWTVVD